MAIWSTRIQLCLGSLANPLAQPAGLASLNGLHEWRAHAMLDDILRQVLGLL